MILCRGGKDFFYKKEETFRMNISLPYLKPLCSVFIYWSNPQVCDLIRSNSCNCCSLLPLNVVLPSAPNRLIAPITNSPIPIYHIMCTSCYFFSLPFLVRVCLRAYLYLRLGWEEVSICLFGWCVRRGEAIVAS